MKNRNKQNQKVFLVCFINFILLFCVISSSLASTVNLSVTGQTTKYAAGDDGDIQAGQVWPVSRFKDNGDGTVSDNLTGLMWLKDASCLGQQTWAAALKKVDDLNAKNITCSGYTANYTDWHLPNINELESLINAQQSNIATWLNSQGFSNVQSGAYPSSIYWSGTTYAANTSYAWYIEISRGFNYYVNKSTAYYAWAVRSGQSGGFGNSVTWKTGQTQSYASGDDGSTQSGVSWPSPRFSDNSDGTVTDNLTGLMWLKDASCLGGQTWPDAFTKISDLNAKNITCSTYTANYTDWRLPNEKELHSLNDYSKYSPSLPQGNPFINVQSDPYWSSTIDAFNTSYVWDVYMSYGATSDHLIHPQVIDYVWPVRLGQARSIITPKFQTTY